MAQPIDYMLPAGFKGTLSLEITDATGRVVRTVGSAAEPRAGRDSSGAQDPDDPDMRGGRGRGGAPAALTTKAGHNRYLWDYRWAKADGGPLAAPGSYTAKLLVGTRGDENAPTGSAASRTFEVKVDPGVMKDGTSVADLVDQQNFLLDLRNAMDDAAAARLQLQQVMQKASVQPAQSPGPGESTTQLLHKLEAVKTPAANLQALWARLVTAPGTYQQPMLIDQLASINRVESAADQKVGMESRRRFTDLVKQLKEIQSALQRWR